MGVSIRKLTGEHFNKACLFGFFFALGDKDAPIFCVYRGNLSDEGFVFLLQR